MSGFENVSLAQPFKRTSALDGLFAFIRVIRSFEIVNKILLLSPRVRKAENSNKGWDAVDWRVGLLVKTFCNNIQGHVGMPRAADGIVCHIPIDGGYCVYA
jgi:hypothetical protein